MKNSAVLFFILASFFVSCISLKKVDRSNLLFQKGLDSLGKAEKRPVIIHPHDNIGINFYTQATPNQEQVEIFNVLAKPGYTVDELGMITVPVIGKIKAADYTPEQLADTLSKKIALYVKKPLVIVSSPTIKVIVMGENSKKGFVELPTNNANLANLLAVAGFSENARIDNILLIREDSVTHIRKPFRINLHYADSLYLSPVFQLQQNDLVYTDISEDFLRDKSFRKANQNLQKIQPFIIGLGIVVSLLSVVLLVTKF